MRAKTILGREPAAWVGLIEAGLALLVAFVLDFDQEQTALIMAVVVAAFGLYTAWATHDTMLGVIVGFAKAVLALALGFGVTLTADQAATILAFVTVAAGFFQRTQTFPEGDPPAPLPGATPVSDVGTT